jgi:hypothetical protein
MSTAAALHAGREAAFLATGLGRFMVRAPIVFAVLAWLAFSIFTGFSRSLSANPHETREVRSQCSSSGRVAGGPGCELGTGVVIMTVTYDHTRTIAAMDQGAARSLQLASVFTAGAFCVAVFSLFGGSRREARQRRRYIGAAVDHVKDGRARAKRDVEGAKARLGKVGERRQKQVGRRWSRQVAAGEVPTELGPVDRWIFRQAKPPKAQRKAKRAARKVGKASEKAEQTAIDAEWASELATVERPTLLSPFDGPPLSPVQREEYAARQVDEAAAARQRLAIDTADLFDRSTP